MAARLPARRVATFLRNDIKSWLRLPSREAEHGLRPLARERGPAPRRVLRVRGRLDPHAGAAEWLGLASTAELDWFADRRRRESKLMRRPVAALSVPLAGQAVVLSPGLSSRPSRAN